MSKLNNYTHRVPTFTWVEEVHRFSIFPFNSYLIIDVVVDIMRFSIYGPKVTGNFNFADRFDQCVPLWTSRKWKISSKINRFSSRNAHRNSFLCFLLLWFQLFDLRRQNYLFEYLSHSFTNFRSNSHCFRNSFGFYLVCVLFHSSKNLCIRSDLWAVCCVCGRVCIIRCYYIDLLFTVQDK